MRHGRIMSGFVASLLLTFLVFIPQTEAGIPPFMKEQVAQCVQTIREDPNPQARLKAVVTLHENYVLGAIWVQVGRGGALYLPSHLSELVQLFERETDFKVKLVLGILCARLGDRTPVPLLVSVLEEGKYPELGYETGNMRSAFDIEGGTGHIPYTQLHLLRGLQFAGDARASAALIKLYEQVKEELPKTQEGSDTPDQLALLRQVSRAMASTGVPEAIGLLVKDLKENTEGEVLRCKQAAAQVGALSNKRVLENPEGRQIFIALLLKNSCEEVRTSAAAVLGSIRDNPEAHAALLKASSEDADRSVRREAVESLWSPGFFRDAYIKQLQLGQETDLKRQQRLLDDFLFWEKEMGNPLHRESLQELQTIQKGMAIKRLQATVSKILDVERENALASYKGQLDSRDKGYGTYPDSVRAEYIDALRVLSSSLSQKDIQRVEALAQREDNAELQRALLKLIEDYQALRKERRER